MPIRRVMTAAENEAAAVNGEAAPPVSVPDTVDGPEIATVANGAQAELAKTGSETTTDTKEMQAEKKADGDGPAKEMASEKEKDEAMEDDKDVAKKEEEDKEIDVDGLMAQGKRDFYCGEYLKSVSTLQRVCEAIAAKHGEMANEIAEPYLLYGKALLEVARIESDVLGNALDGIPEEQEAATPAENGSNDLIEKDSLTEEEKEKISEQVIDAMTEDDEAEKTDDVNAEKQEEKVDAKEQESVDAKEQESVDAKEEEKVESKEKDKETKDEETKEAGGEDADMQDADEKEEGDKEEEEEEEGDEEGEEGAEEEEEEEEVGNLQIAWEVLEVARKIFSSQENWLRVAECHVCLAEVGMEKEDWTQAEEDLISAIRTFTEQANVAKGDRRLATAYFQLAVASLADKKYAESKRAFDDSIIHLQTRATELNDRMKANDGAEQLTEAKRAELEKEVKELDELIDELRQRIVEVDEERIDFEMMRKQLRAGVSSISGAASSNSDDTASGVAVDAPSDAVNDISGLVRKKRKVEEPSEAVAPSPSKKLKTDSETDGAEIHPDADMPLSTAKTEETPKVKTVEDVKMAAEQESAVEQA